MQAFEQLLKGSDLRTIGNSNKVVHLVTNQQSFDELFKLLFHTDRHIVMRAADAIEKITKIDSAYLQPHKKQLIKLCTTVNNYELKWHLAQLIPRLILTEHEIRILWEILIKWAANKNESKIVRVNSIQGLSDLLPGDEDYKRQFKDLISSIKKENISSINARIKKLDKILIK